jgi:hypothetical protein
MRTREKFDNSVRLAMAAHAEHDAFVSPFHRSIRSRG